MSIGTAGAAKDVYGALLRTVDQADSSKADLVQSVDGGKLIAVGYHWNTSTLAYEVNTGGTASGSDVNVTNFPATQAVTQSGTWTVQQGTPPWSASQSGTWNIGTVSTVTGVTTVSTVTGVTTVTSLTQFNGQPIALNTGTRSAGTLRVTVATDDLVPVSAASLPLPTGAATEATQLLQATETTLSKLTQTQGTSSSSVVGPMVQALVSDGPESYLDNTVRPFSLTNEGRLRVSTLPALRDISFFDDNSTPTYITDPAYIASPWASSIW